MCSGAGLAHVSSSSSRLHSSEDSTDAKWRIGPRGPATWATMSLSVAPMTFTAVPGASMPENAVVQVVSAYALWMSSSMFLPQALARLHRESCAQLMRSAKERTTGCSAHDTPTSLRSFQEGPVTRPPGAPRGPPTAPGGKVSGVCGAACGADPDPPPPSTWSHESHNES
eukprot:7424713-Pyramimonas_sp.AAC.2